MQNRLGAKSWERLFTFSLVRNPWDRMWSMFNYRKVCGELKPQMDFESYLELLFKEPDNSAQSPFSYHGHYYQCVDYLTDEQGNLMVDFVGRFENRQQDLRQVTALCGLQDLSSLHLNQLSEEGHYRQYYTRRCREMVARWAAKDIAYFNYNF